MVDRKQLDILDILDNISYDDFRSTSEIARKLKINWSSLFGKLLYLEYRGYIKFIEINHVRMGMKKTTYAWKRLHESDEKNKSVGRSILEVLNYVSESNFETTTAIAKKSGMNAYILKSKLLYLESRGYVACFRLGSKKAVIYNWRRFGDEERNKFKNSNGEENRKRFEKECFRYNDK